MNNSKLSNNFLSYFISECKNKNALTLAASSSFFFILCLVPFTIIIFKTFTLFFSENNMNINQLIVNIKLIVPEEVFPTVQYLLKHVQSLELGKMNKSYIHNIVLIVSSLSFFGSIWKSLDIITEEKQHGTIIKTIKSIGAIIVSSLFFLTLIVIPVFLKSFKIFITKEYLATLNAQSTFGFLKNITDSRVFNINTIAGIALFLFFIAFFKYILQKNARMSSIIMGSILFTCLIITTKFGFISYLIITKSNLMGNYGSMYSAAIFLLWIFISIFSFYTSIIFAISHSNHFYYKDQIQI